MVLIPGWGTKIPHAVQRRQKIFFFFKHVKLFSRTEGPLLRRTTTDLTFYCGHLQLPNFWTRDPTFLFCTALEEGMATHSSILAWRIQWAEEPGGLQSMGSHRVGHNWSDLACTHVVNYEASPAPRINDCPALVCPFQTLCQDPRWDSPTTPASSPLSFPVPFSSSLVCGTDLLLVSLANSIRVTWKRGQDLLQISIRISGWHFSGGSLVGLKYLWGSDSFFKLFCSWVSSRELLSPQSNCPRQGKFILGVN